MDKNFKYSKKSTWLNLSKLLVEKTKDFIS